MIEKLITEIHALIEKNKEALNLINEGGIPNV